MDHHLVIVMGSQAYGGQGMNRLLNQAVILYWMMLNPVKLFKRINALDWYQSTLRAWIDDLNLPANAHTLEVACATGLLTEYLATSGFNAIGIDVSEKMITAALANKDHSGQYQTADAKSLPFKDASFDAAISASLLNTISEPEKVMAEMARICKSGGTVSVLVPKQAISESQIAELIKSQCSTALSAEVLSTWHKRAPKMRPEDVMDLFNQGGLTTNREREYLGGMVTTVSGVRL
jgi:ubiquinone/menaquinone biosynthesis C-methylase UbiE